MPIALARVLLLAPRALIVASLLAWTAATLPVAAVPVRAGGGLVTAMDAVYEVQPEHARVRVTVDAVSTSHEADSPEGPVYFAGITLTIPPDSSNITATSAAGSRLQVTVVSSNADAVTVDIGFSEAVFLGDSYAYRVAFDMVDPGGASDRDFRIGHSVAAFPVWALGSSGAVNSVTVILPAGFVPSIYGGPLGLATQADGSTRLAADVADPASWFAYITAERPGIFTTSAFGVTVGEAAAQVSIRAWDDDPSWATRTQQLLTDGLPALHDLIGLRWPVVGSLVVEESANRLGDYAGIYHPQTEKINVRFDADPTVTLHEAAHIWFNDSLFGDRWIGEAWAEFYAVEAAQTIGVTGQTFTLTDDLLDAQIPLNDWGAIGRESVDVEAFAYAASYHMAQLIAERTTVDALRSVWQAADAGESAYQPVHATGSPRAGVAATQEGWQRLLDLLEERTDVAYDDLWAAWVVNHDQALMLADRTDARTHYAQVVVAAGDWELPQLIRFDMASWQFDDAEAELDRAESVLEVAHELSAKADEMGLTPPTDLRKAFEGSGGLASALFVGQRELDSIEVIADATAAVAEPPSVVEQVGLLFEDPGADLTAAQDAWQSGDDAEAVDHANAALAVMTNADEQGQQRLLAAGAVVVLIVGGGVVAIRRRRSPERAAPGADLTVGPTETAQVADAEAGEEAIGEEPVG